MKLSLSAIRLLTALLLATALAIFISGCEDDAIQPAVLLATIPTAEETGVMVITPISIVFSSPLTATSVDTNTVRVNRYSDGNRRRELGDVSYDASTNRITFQPYITYPHAQWIEVNLIGLVDSLGNIIPDTIYRFRTRGNPVTEVHNFAYNTGTFLFDMTGRQKYTSYDDGSLKTLINYSGAGPVSGWFDGDELFSYTFNYQINSDFNTTTLEQINNPDGLPGTGDEFLLSYEIHTFDPDNHMETRVDKNDGPSGNLIQFWVNEFTPTGFATGKLMQGWGANLTMFDSDDTGWARQYVRDDQGFLLQMIQYTGIGSDFTFGTADDVFASLTEYLPRDPITGISLGNVFYIDGGDGVLGSGDEFISRVVNNVFDANNRIELQQTITGSGGTPDWFDGDEVTSTYILYYYNQHGQILKGDTYYAGGDGVMNTGDDVLIRSTETSYNAEGQRIHSTTLNLGADSILNTADDTKTIIFYDISK